MIYTLLRFLDLYIGKGLTGYYYNQLQSHVLHRQVSLEYWQSALVEWEGIEVCYRDQALTITLTI